MAIVIYFDYRLSTFILIFARDYETFIEITSRTTSRNRVAGGLVVVAATIYCNACKISSGRAGGNTGDWTYSWHSVCDVHQRNRCY